MSVLVASDTDLHWSDGVHRFTPPGLATRAQTDAWRARIEAHLDRHRDPETALELGVPLHIPDHP